MRKCCTSSTDQASGPPGPGTRLQACEPVSMHADVRPVKQPACRGSCRQSNKSCRQSSEPSALSKLHEKLPRAECPGQSCMRRRWIQVEPWADWSVCHGVLQCASRRTRCWSQQHYQVWEIIVKVPGLAVHGRGRRKAGPHTYLRSQRGSLSHRFTQHKGSSACANLYTSRKKGPCKWTSRL